MQKAPSGKLLHAVYNLLTTLSNKLDEQRHQKLGKMSADNVGEMFGDNMGKMGGNNMGEMSGNNTGKLSGDNVGEINGNNVGVISGDPFSLYNFCGYKNLKLLINSKSSVRIDNLFKMLKTSYENTAVATFTSATSSVITTLGTNSMSICASCLAALYAISIQLDRSNYVYLHKKPVILNKWAKHDIQTGRFVELYINILYIIITSNYYEIYH
jgi:hypothetical protein